MATNVNNNKLSTVRFNSQTVKLIRVNGQEVWSYNKILLKNMAESYTYRFNNITGFTWTSNNDGMDDETAYGKWQIKSNINTNYEILCAVSSEANYDKLSVWFDGTLIVNGISGETTISKTVSLQANVVHVIEARYEKDGSVSNGSDKATLTLPCDGTF